jgi:hypothetical protein
LLNLDLNKMNKILKGTDVVTFCTGIAAAWLQKSAGQPHIWKPAGPG